MSYSVATDGARNEGQDRPADGMKRRLARTRSHIVTRRNVQRRLACATRGTANSSPRAPELRGKVPGIVAVKPERDKVSRMAIVRVKFESGPVFLPERAPWLAEFERELFAFPGDADPRGLGALPIALRSLCPRASPPGRGKYSSPGNGQSPNVFRTARNDA